MRFHSTFALLVCCGLATAATAGPVFPSRPFSLAPAFRSPYDTVKGAAYLRQQGIWGDLSRGFNSANDRFGWSIAFGGVIQFVDWEHSQIYMVGDVEVLSDTHNDISFNPRAIFWTEGFMYGVKLGETELHLGYIHRCHHDIDDLDANELSNHEERTLIYGSLQAKAIWRSVAPLSVANSFNTSALLQWDQYVLRQDDRIPTTSTTAYDVRTLDASVSLGIRSELTSLGAVHPYVRAQTCVASYDGFATTTVDGRVEVGMSVRGSGLSMDIFLGYERLNDDYNSVQLVRSAYPYLGFRFVSAAAGL